MVGPVACEQELPRVEPDLKDSKDFDIVFRQLDDAVFSLLELAFKSCFEIEGTIAECFFVHGECFLLRTDFDNDDHFI